MDKYYSLYVCRYPTEIQSGPYSWLHYDDFFSVGDAVMAAHGFYDHKIVECTVHRFDQEGNILGNIL